MKFVATVALAVALAAPASAITYQFDYTLGSSTGGAYFDAATRTYVSGDVTVSGYLETDGTLGDITAENVEAWQFTITGRSGSLTFGSPPTFASQADVIGSFFATADYFIATSSAYKFIESASSYEPGPGTKDYTTSTTFGVLEGTADGRFERAFYRTASIFCSGQTCTPHFDVRDFAYGTTSTTGRHFLGTAIPVTEVPLPSAMSFFLIGLGGLGIFRRRAA